MTRYMRSVLIAVVLIVATAVGMADEQKKEMRRLINSVKYYDNLLKELAADPLAEASSTTND